MPRALDQHLILQWLQQSLCPEPLTNIWSSSDFSSHYAQSPWPTFDPPVTSAVPMPRALDQHLILQWLQQSLCPEPLTNIWSSSDFSSHYAQSLWPTFDPPVTSAVTMPRALDQHLILQWLQQSLCPEPLTNIWSSSDFSRHYAQSPWPTFDPPVTSAGTMPRALDQHLILQWLQQALCPEPLTNIWSSSDFVIILHQP